MDLYRNLLLAFIGIREGNRRLRCADCVPGLQQCHCDRNHEELREQADRSKQVALPHTHQQPPNAHDCQPHCNLFPSPGPLENFYQYCICTLTCRPRSPLPAARPSPKPLDATTPPLAFGFFLNEASPTHKGLDKNQIPLIVTSRRKPASL